MFSTTVAGLPCTLVGQFFKLGDTVYHRISAHCNPNQSELLAAYAAYDQQVRSTGIDWAALAQHPDDDVRRMVVENLQQLQVCQHDLNPQIANLATLYNAVTVH